MAGRPALFDADDTRGKYFSGAAWTAQIPNSGIRDGATRYIGPRGARRTGVSTAFMADVLQQEMDALIAGLRDQVIEEQAIIHYLSEYEADWEISMSRVFLPGWLLDNVDMNSSIADWCYEYRMNDTHIRSKSLDDKCYRLIPSLESAIKTWFEDAPSLTPDSFYELEAAVISLHPSD